MLGNKGLAFSFKLTLGDSFCFSLDTMGARTHPAPIPAKKKKKSQSAKRRDKKRRLEFLSRKKTVTSPGALLPVLTYSSASPRVDLHSPVTPGEEAAFQRDTLATNRSESHLCICGALPCVCLACHPLSPKEDHHVPKVKLRSQPLAGLQHPVVIDLKHPAPPCPTPRFVKTAATPSSIPHINVRTTRKMI